MNDGTGGRDAALRDLTFASGVCMSGSGLAGAVTAVIVGESLRDGAHTFSQRTEAHLAHILPAACWICLCFHRG